MVSSASAAAAAGDRWLPLESNPDVLNQFMWALGVPEGEAELHDVYGIDADELEAVPQPVLAVIFLFPDPPQNESDTADAECVAASGEKETCDRVYFIKQIESLGNACGTIGLLHAIGNAYPEIKLSENSCLERFLKSTATMDPYERAVFLEKDNEMQQAHSLAASAGDTEPTADVEEHYICFVSVNGRLYELDGMKHGPIQHGSSSANGLLQDAVCVIKTIMRNIPNSINFNVMVLSGKAK